MAPLVPTEEDWGNWSSGDLDVAYAHKIFAGKTNLEVQPDFYRCVIERTDELRWMPKVPFQYYILGFRDFVISGKFASYDSSDAASCFLGLIEEKLQTQPDYVVPVMQELIPAVEYVAEHQEQYAADAGIYGNFMEKRKSIESLYRTYMLNIAFERDEKWPS